MSEGLIAWIVGLAALVGVDAVVGSEDMTQGPGTARRSGTESGTTGGWNRYREATRQYPTAPRRRHPGASEPIRAAATGTRTTRVPTPEELDRMSPEELARLAAALDDVEIVQKRRRWPIPGTRAEKRAERGVAAWFVISALSGLAFLVAFVAWPSQYVPPDDPGHLAVLAVHPGRRRHVRACRSSRWASG